MLKPEKKDIPGPKEPQPEVVEVLTIPAGGGLGGGKPVEPKTEQESE
jgi:hypothetical protein